MGFFKNIFKRKKVKEEKKPEQECWYNNSQEYRQLGEPQEGMAFSENWYGEMAVSNQIAKS